MKETPKPEKKKRNIQENKKNNDCKFQDVFRLPNLSGPRQDCKWILCFFLPSVDCAVAKILRNELLFFVFCVIASSFPCFVRLPFFACLFSLFRYYLCCFCFLILPFFLSCHLYLVLLFVFSLPSLMCLFLSHCCFNFFFFL